MIGRFDCRVAFADALVSLAEADQRVVAVCEQLQGRDDNLDALVAKLRGAPGGGPDHIEALRAHAVRLLS